MRLIAILTLVCVIAALILGVVYKNTAPLIAAQKEKETQAALVQALPDADNFISKEKDSQLYYEGYKNKKLIGYVIFAEGNGYAGAIEMLVGIDKTGTITGLEILNHQETPGLGALCTEIKYGEKDPWFTRQFKQKRATDLTRKNIETITGATITSEAVMKGVKEQIETFLKK